MTQKEYEMMRDEFFRRMEALKEWFEVMEKILEKYRPAHVEIEHREMKL